MKNSDRRFVVLTMFVLFAAMPTARAQQELKPVQSVFDQPAVFPKHRQLQVQFLRAFRAGKIAEMEAACREGVALMPLDPTWRYNLACALAYRADKHEALAALDRAVELGFRNAEQIAGDRDLATLKDNPAFQAILEKAKRLADAPVAGVTPVRPTLAVMGLPAEVSVSNTVWDLDAGCFKSFFQLVPPAGAESALAAVKAAAASYTGPEAPAIVGWLRDGTAAGLFGTLYVNRDGGHSPLVVSNFPGLTPVRYSNEARAKRVDTGAANSVFDYPVLGNASVAVAAGPYWRSVPRMMISETTPFRLYLANQLWFYPAHRDYVVPTGDLFPANTPYSVISLGSSGTDQPFLQAFAAAMAALQPATARVLLERHELAPTLQMLFRLSQKSVKKPEDYLTGAAHPVVFDAKDLDVAGFVRRAHALKSTEIPPLVILKVVHQEPPVPGVDYFDLAGEDLLDSPCAIGRLARNVRTKKYRLSVRAQTLTQKPSTFIWKILQGDPAKITVKPLDAASASVEISAEDPGLFRETDSDGTPALYTSSRIDIGCFVRQGDLFSAPSFVSIYWLPNEIRIYREDGQIQSVNYSNMNHNYADPYLTLAKNWKDLYEYDAENRLLGWYRTYVDGSRSDRFAAAGFRVLTTDRLNRPLRVCRVQYLPKQPAANQPPTILSCMDTAKTFEYQYENEKDRVGKVKSK